MRLAISGSHATGKSTLAAELSSVLAHFAVVDEAYSYLLDEGHGFGIEPSIEDFVTQLRRSVTLTLENAGPNVIFDRCPVDYIAYLVAVKADFDELRQLTDEATHALGTLDAVIFVPVEAGGRISVSSEDLPRLRKRVDSAFREILLEDSWDLKLPTLQVHGSPADRVKQVLGWMKAPGPPACS